MISKEKKTEFLKQLAKQFGFLSCGISKADFLEKEASRLEDFLNKNYNGEMSYLENNFDKRLDPRLLVEGAKSVISFTYNYFPSEENLQTENSYKVSKYAYGRDYHKVIKKKLKHLTFRLVEAFGDFNYRIFVDSAPVLEKAWAAKSGLGWVGKNTNLITKKTGSFYFLAEIICDLEFDYDLPVTDYCGSCRKCIESCPTDALIEPYKLDASKCISYLNIELKKEIPTSFNKDLEDWVYGCDICQDVCPWNRFSKSNTEIDFNPKGNWQSWTKEEWEEMTETMFQENFYGTPLKRAGFEKLKNNIKSAKPMKV